MPARVTHRARLALLSVVVIAVALFVIVVGQAVVASQQVRIDDLHARLSAAVNTNEDLQLSRAQLESPGRVLVIAQRQLHMVVPKAVTYLQPVDPGPAISSSMRGR